jgi:hypothetical protein
MPVTNGTVTCGKKLEAFGCIFRNIIAMKMTTFIWEALICMSLSAIYAAFCRRCQQINKTTESRVRTELVYTGTVRTLDPESRLRTELVSTGTNQILDPESRVRTELVSTCTVRTLHLESSPHGRLMRCF